MNDDMELEKIIRCLRKYPTNEIAKFFSKQERICYQNNDKGIITEREFSGRFSRQKICIKPWLFPELIYYGTFGNDYRGGLINELDMWNVYGKYQDYDIDSEGRYLDNSDINKYNSLTYILYGVAQQQFVYQKSYKYINRLSRNYHILKSLNIEGVTLNYIVKERFNMSVNTYIQYLTLIAILSMKHVVLNERVVLDIVRNTEDYFKVINYLAVDYDDCRKTPLKKDIFKVKPILISQKGECIVPSFCLMMYNLGDNLYWLFKDKFSHGNKFVVKFGELFEDYVFEILTKHFKEKVVRIPRVEGEKSADFLIESDNFTYIFEIKSGVAKLNSKTAVLNQNSLNEFIKNNITDALAQIDSSAIHFKNKHVIPIIVNFDVLFTEDALLHNIDSLYNAQNFNVKEAILLEIDDFEKLIYTFKTLEKIDKLIKDVMGFETEMGGIKIYKLLENTHGHKGYYYEDKFNVNKKLLKGK